MQAHRCIINCNIWLAMTLYWILNVDWKGRYCNKTETIRRLGNSANIPCASLTHIYFKVFTLNSRFF